MSGAGGGARLQLLEEYETHFCPLMLRFEEKFYLDVEGNSKGF